MLKVVYIQCREILESLHKKVLEDGEKDEFKLLPASLSLVKLKQY
jgi:hypothetical protein